MKKLTLKLAVLGSLLCAALHRTFATPDSVALANYEQVMPRCGDTKLADEAIGRFKLTKFGSDANHIALCDAADIPLGFTRDSSASVAEESLAQDLLGLSDKATQGTASGAVTAGNLVCPGNNGTLRDITLLSGTTVYVCGRALTAAADGGTFVWIPFAPVQRVIA